MLGKRLSSFILFFTVVFPLATRTAAQNHEEIMAEVKRLQVQVSQLESNQIQLEQAVQRVESLLLQQDTAVRRALVDTGTTLEGLQQSLLVLSEKLDETNARLGNLRQEMASLRPSQPIVIPEGGVPPPEGGEETPPEMLPPSVAVGAADLYQQAYTDYTQGRYPLAISGFKDVIAAEPDSDLADNSQYWIGECLLAQRQYREALEAFDAVLSLYPASNKRPEATYKKAVALDGLGSRDDAIRQLELVIENYAGTPAARAAEGMLRSLRQ